MKQKINVNKLYVGNPYFENHIMIEPFIQYETFGDTLHEVYVFTKKHLFEETKDGYLLCGTKYVFKDNYPTKSYHTSGCCSFNLYNEYRSWGEIIGPPQRLLDSLQNQYDPKIEFGYFISFKDFIKKTLNIDINGKISYSQAKILLVLANMKRIKRLIKLEEYNNEEQLEKYNLTDIKNKIKKKVRSE